MWSGCCDDVCNAHHSEHVLLDLKIEGTELDIDKTQRTLENFGVS